MNQHKLTGLLAEKLHLDLPPVVLGFADECPDGAYTLAKPPPSFCVLWRWGEDRVFWAPASEHVGCAIGGMVAGFVSADDNPSELAAALAEMCEEGEYDPGEEIAATARFSHQSAGIVYGPLWEFTLDPLVMVMWATLPQIGVLQEIVGNIMWRENPRGAVFTRPACSVLAIADAHEAVAMSTGCAGMRAYTGIPAKYMLTAIHGSKLAEIEEGLGAKTDIEERLKFYEEQLTAGMSGGT